MDPLAPLVKIPVDYVGLGSFGRDDQLRPQAGDDRRVIDGTPPIGRRQRFGEAHGRAAKAHRLKGARVLDHLMKGAEPQPDVVHRGHGGRHRAGVPPLS